ncbi:MAG: hypothetical protein A3E79_02825 [Burkholderiales bacterium RIFCSPHIGHO2_12_FULL_61_11]|nr:MAG: hypothetical protein A3E79_02825 [Burkholderiales bacterium RIFCSPHIGHO2_12_FULL_61_11]
MLQCSTEYALFGDCVEEKGLPPATGGRLRLAPVHRRDLVAGLKQMPGRAHVNNAGPYNNNFHGDFF